MNKASQKDFDTGLAARAPLSRLLLGREAREPIHVRDTNGAGIEELARAIQENDFELVQPILVRPEHQKGDDLLVVIAGNRRLLAFRHLLRAGIISGDWMIDVAVRNCSVEQARAMALAENDPALRLPMHPVEQYRHFAALNKSPEELAAYFGCKIEVVRQRLALGRLSPLVLDGWLAGEYGAEVAQTFTLAPDHKDQDALLKRLRKQDNVSRYAVRNALTTGQDGAAELVKLVGVDRYVNAGGRIVADLFDRRDSGAIGVVSDVALARKMATEAIDAKCAELRADGWAWAEPVIALPQNAVHMWPRTELEGTSTKDERARLKALDAIIDPRHADDVETDDEAVDAAIEERDGIRQAMALRIWTPELKAKHGCIVGVRDGAFHIDVGVRRPVEGKSSAGAKVAKKEKAARKSGETAPVSNALMERLSETLTFAVGEVLQNDRRVGLRALLAGFESTHYGGHPVTVRHNGKGARDSKRHGFEAVFTGLMKVPDARVLEGAAKMAALALDMTSHNAQAVPLADKGCMALACALDQRHLAAALKARLDWKNYWTSVSRDSIAAAVGEAINADEARKVGKMAKGDAVKWAIANLPGKTGWLPPELRTATYTGPGAKKGRTR